MQLHNRPFPDLSAVFCDDLLVQDAEMFYGARRDTFFKAVNLRAEQTTAEALLWEKLRRKQLNGYRFRRQHPIGNYIADFYCRQAKLVIEIDGSVHEKPDQKTHDTHRTEEMNSLGIRVIRFTNYHINSYMDEVLLAIRRALAAPPLQRWPGGGTSSQ